MDFRLYAYVLYAVLCITKVSLRPRNKIAPQIELSKTVIINIYYPKCRALQEQSVFSWILLKVIPLNRVLARGMEGSSSCLLVGVS